MPIYEYHCPSCHKKREMFRGVESRTAPLMCECGTQMFATTAPAPSKLREPSGDKHRPPVRNVFKKIGG